MGNTGLSFQKFIHNIKYLNTTKHIKHIREKIKMHSLLVQNFSYLSLLRIFNMLLPLITYPYLIRVLGEEKYGLVVFAQAIIAYLVILVGFGFNLSATKDVSVNRNDKDKLGEIVSSVLIIKTLLFIVSALAVWLIIQFVAQAREHQLLFFYTLWMCMYEAIFPIWYFQGIEKMKYITYLTLVSRLFFLCLIFVFIRSSEDYLFIPILNGVGALISGFISLYIIIGKHKIKLSIQPVSVLKQYFLDSFPIFISNISIQIYATTNKVIAGALLGMREVAYYDLGEKIVSLIKVPVFIVNQSIFPKVAREKNKLFLNKIIRYLLIFAAVVTIPLLIFSTPVIKILGGVEMLPSLSIVRILILTLIPVTISVIYANTYMIAWGLNREYMKIRIYANLVYVVLIAVTLIFKLIDMNTLAYITLIVETFIAAASMYYYRNQDKPAWKK